MTDSKIALECEAMETALLYWRFRLEMRHDLNAADAYTVLRARHECEVRFLRAALERL